MKNQGRLFRRGNLRLHIGPLIVWLCAIAVVVVMFANRPEQFHALGIVQNSNQQVSSQVTGRLDHVTVDLFEPVRKGQVIAVLDGEHIEAQLTVIQAQINQLMAELVPAAESMLADAAELQSDWLADNRRFAVDVESRRLNVMNLRTEIETDKIRLLDMELEVRIAEDLVEREAISEYELQKAQTAYEIVDTRLSQNQQNLAQAQADLRQAMVRRDTFIEQVPYVQPVDSVLESIRKNIEIQERMIDQLLVEKEQLTLLAPCDGIVSEMYYRTGETIRPGDPILRISSNNPGRIMLYTRHGQQAINVGTEIEVAGNSPSPQYARATVLHVGPEYTELPAQLRRDPSIPEWGRPVVVEMPEHMQVVPGELVRVRRPQ